MHKYYSGRGSSESERGEGSGDAQGKKLNGVRGGGTVPHDYAGGVEGNNRRRRDFQNGCTGVSVSLVGGGSDATRRVKLKHLRGGGGVSC